MNIVRQWAFERKMMCQTEEKNEAMKLNIVLYNRLLAKDEEVKQVAEEKLKVSKKKKKKLKIDMGLGKFEVSTLLGKIDEWTRAIEDNMEMIELIKQQHKKFILF